MGLDRKTIWGLLDKILTLDEMMLHEEKNTLGSSSDLYWELSKTRESLADDLYKLLKERNAKS